MPAIPYPSFWALTLLLSCGTSFFLCPILAQAQTALSPSADQKIEADRLLQQGSEQFKVSKFTEALQSWQQALKLYQVIGDRLGEANTLGNLGTVFNSLGRYDKAIDYHQRALKIAHELNNREVEARILGGLGTVYQNLGQPQKAIEYHQQSLDIAREIKNPQVQAVSLRQLGSAYQSLGESSQASQFQQQSIAIQQEFGKQWNQQDSSGNVILTDPSGNLVIVQSSVNRSQTVSLGNGGFAQIGNGNFTQTIPLGNGGFAQIGNGNFTQTVPLGNGGFAQIGNGNFTQTVPLGNGGFAQIGNGNFTQTVPLGNGGFARIGNGNFTQTIPLGNGGFAQIGNGNFTQTVPLGNGGFAQIGNGNFTQTIPLGNGVFIEVGNGGFLQTVTLGNGNVEQDSDEIEVIQQSLATARSTRDRRGIAKAFVRLGDRYQSLGQYQEAVNSYQQHLATVREIPEYDRTTEANALGNLGNAYQALRQYQQAINYHQQHLTLARAINDKQGEATALGNLGNDYEIQGVHEQAISFYQQHLSKSREIGDRQGEANALGNLGNAYQSLGQSTEAMNFYQKSLAIKRLIQDRSGEGVTLANIGRLLSKQNQPESAIVFYKESVNITESIRQDLRGLPRDQQQSYTQTVEFTYRQLADLLLSQGRLLEAQQVLELLKIQEIDHIDQEIRATLKSSVIDYTPTETAIKTEHGNLVALGEKLYTCETNPNTCQPNQLQQWQAERQHLTDQFDQTLKNAETKAKNHLTQSAVAGKDDFIKGYQSIVEAQPGTLLIYPFITDDKIWLLWASTGGVLGSTEVPAVGRQELLKAVKDFRDRLQNPSSDPAEIQKLQQSSQQLYQWLVAPLEPALASKNIKHLVFSLDGTTRDIPMSALFDGQQYLLQRYTISTVLSANLTRMGDRLPSSPKVTSVLALGVSQGFPSFPALTNVPTELAAIHGIYPGENLLNADFNEQTLSNHLNNQKILHIATHADFLPTNPKNSYLLLGNGKPYPIRQIQYLRNLAKVHLVVLSACNTGLSEADPDGNEILGISAYFTGGDSKAKAVLASLWQVNDASTSLLMQRFYQNLASGKMTKAEALQQAQITLLNGQQQSQGVGNRSSVNYSSDQGVGKAAISRDLSHPYYWAPFILIGNGL